MTRDYLMIRTKVAVPAGQPYRLSLSAMLGLRCLLDWCDAAELSAFKLSIQHLCYYVVYGQGQPSRALDFTG